MATMSITLTDPMKDWVEARTRDGHYVDASDYMRELIRRDQERADVLVEMQRLLDEGFESGISDRSMSEILDSARAQAGTLPRP